jgi:hypothetical protein
LVKRILLAVLQLFKFVVFLFVLFVGGNWDELVNLPLEIRAMQNHTTPAFLIPTMKYDAGPTHFIIANGLVYAAALLVLILLYEAFRKKLKPWALFTLAEWAIAVIIALLIKGWTIHAS